MSTEGYTDGICTGVKCGKVSHVFLFHFKNEEDKKKHDSLPDPHATYFLMQCFEEGKLDLINVPQ